jgi:two-component system, response regulator YesN
MPGILIADDTPLIRSALSKIIAESNLGIEPVLEASDGDEAIEKATQHKPDIILMDIRMPGTCGLSASEEILKQLPNTKIIILTAYNEFAYAQKAVHLGVHEYLLKPVRPARLLSVLTDLAADLESAKKKAGRHSNEPERQEKENWISRHFVETTLVQHLTRGSTPEEYSVHACLSYLEKRISWPAVLVFGIEQEIQSDSGEPMRICAELARTVENAFPNSSTILTGCHTPDTVVAVISTGHTLATNEQITEFAESVAEKVSETLETPVTVGVGRRLSHLHQIPVSYTEAYSAAKATSPSPSGNGSEKKTDVRLGSSAGTTAEDESTRYLAVEKRLIEAVRLHDRRAAEKSLNEILNHLERRYGDSLHTTMNHCAEIMAVVAHDIGSSHGCELEILKTLDRRVTELAVTDTVNGVRNWALSYLTELLSIQTSRNEEKDPVQAALEYLHNHYARPDISLTDLASAVNLSASHLASLIRTKTGMSYVRNLTAIRIDHAKRLLRRTNYSVADIAYMVGYRNVTNFYRLFQREVSVTPGAFRENLESIR